MKDTGRRVILITVSGEEEAKTIAGALVKEKLAACVNIIPNVRSIYWWEGKVADDSEWLLIVKTREEKFAALSERVLKLHSYQTPEIIAIPVVEGLKSYLEWIDDSLEG